MRISVPGAKKAVSIFVYWASENAWAEYVVVYSIGRKAKKPVKFASSLVWRSSKAVAFSAAQRGSFATEKEAYQFMEKILAQEGGKIIRMNKKTLLRLTEKYGYPSGRHPYVLESTVISQSRQVRSLRSPDLR